MGRLSCVGSTAADPEFGPGMSAVPTTAGVVRFAVHVHRGPGIDIPYNWCTHMLATSDNPDTNSVVFISLALALLTKTQPIQHPSAEPAPEEESHRLIKALERGDAYLTVSSCPEHLVVHGGSAGVGAYAAFLGYDTDTAPTYDAAGSGEVSDTALMRP